MKTKMWKISKGKYKSILINSINNKRNKIDYKKFYFEEIYL